ncbi:hypothetical protein D9M69_378260 [compost metagenome]
MDDAVLVGTETHLTSLGVLDGSGHVRGHGADLRVRHQAAWTEDLAQLTDDTHRVRGSDDHVVAQVATFHLGSQLIHAYAIGAGSQGSFSARTLGEHGNADAPASAVRQNGGTTNDLVGFTRIDAQVDGHVHGLLELGGSQFSQQFGGIFEAVLLASFYFFGDCLLALGQLSHYTPSTFRPMLRAEPAMLRTAASRSAAVRSAFLALAISSS